MDLEIYDYVLSGMPPKRGGGGHKKRAKQAQQDLKGPNKATQGHTGPIGASRAKRSRQGPNVAKQGETGQNRSI